VYFALYWPALLAAFLITVLEMTEVVILVIAVSADHPSVRPGATGAVVGVAGVSLAAVGVGAALNVISHTYLLWVSAVLLAAFGVVLFRSTVKSYRRASLPPGPVPSSKFGGTLQFGAGVTSGAVEATEVVVVLLGITAAGYALSAIVGALLGGAVLVVLALLVHERLRRIKVPWLKWIGTAMLFTFATFWLGEALGLDWPGADLVLIPLFFASLVLVRALVQLRLGRATVPAAR
jgi:Ca2+/H+ antiporter, TMEM165/GDT1 family